jgi:hypothetical protein
MRDQIGCAQSLLNMPCLSPGRTESALRRLAEMAQREHLVLEIALCHGQILTLAYSDPNARIVPARIVESACRAEALISEVASECRLPRDWLREDVRYYLALFDARRCADFDRFGRSLILSTAESGHVLAMKLHACECACPPEPKDLADVEFLVQKIGLTTWAEVAFLYDRFLPGCVLGGNVRARVTEMFMPSSRFRPIQS